MTAIKLAIVSFWPSLPRWLRSQTWLSRVLMALGLISPAPKRRPSMAIADLQKTADATALYRQAGYSYFVTDALLDLQDRNVARRMSRFLSEISDREPSSDLAAQVSEFRRIYLSCPIGRNDGGANYPSGLALYLIVRHLNPDLIVESGVLRGMSSMIMKAAASATSMHSFDLNFSLLHPTAGVEYHQQDWSTFPIKATPTSFCYFDDHVNQARRLVEAHGRGFKTLMFDDSWSWGALAGCGGVPLPSIDMLMTDDIKVGEQVVWFEGGERMTYTHDAENDRLIRKARSLIRSAHDVPNLYRETGIAPTAAQKLVKLL